MNKIKETFKVIFGVLIMILGIYVALTFSVVGIIVYGVTKTGATKALTLCMNWYIAVPIIIYIGWTTFRASKYIKAGRNTFLNMIVFVFAWIKNFICDVICMIKIGYGMFVGMKNMKDGMKDER